MKALIAAALMIVSVSTFSAETGAVDSLLSVLPIGTYQGQDDAGNSCNVVVNDVNYPAKVLSITVSNNKSTIFKILNEGSEFLFRAYKKEFIQTDRQYVDSSRNSYVDRIIRTVIAGDNTLYVVVANEITVNRDRTVESVECVVNL
ncbi:MAG: hypothetical protein H7177_09610 [Rhizobacter sp.]|nr:hypothetical protein [Bacteriovorax sp.]